MVYIGIDPGVSGAMAIRDDLGIYLFKFDEEKYIDALKRAPANTICCLEHVHSMPKQGVASSFNFGMNFGWIHFDRGLQEALSERESEAYGEQQERRRRLCRSSADGRVRQKEALMPKTRLIDLTGQRFGRLVVLERTGTYKGSDGSGSSPIWKCQCDCGEVVEVIGRNLRYGGTKSCGCIRRDKCRRLRTPGE